MLNNLSATGKFTIRDARPSDGEFIARNVLAAMGYEVFNVDADSAIEFGSTSLNVQVPSSSSERFAPDPTRYIHTPERGSHAWKAMQWDR